MYEYGCRLFRKRIECAVMMQVALATDPELQNIKQGSDDREDCTDCGGCAGCE